VPTVWSARAARYCSRTNHRKTQEQGEVATEALLMSVVASVLGTLIGVGFAWVGHETFVEPALSDATTQMRLLSLAIVVLIAALARADDPIVQRKALRYFQLAGYLPVSPPSPCVH
jgi:hypothetical protein